MIDIKYSQNFYTNQNNLRNIVERANIKTSDLVIDIGAGTGIITEELSKHSEKILAYELDPKYFDILQREFPNSNVLLKNEDFLNISLPEEEFKIFANIPFSLTTDIVNKITHVDSKLKEAFLFVQKESAERFVGKPKNTQISTTLSYLYDIEILEEFKREDFNPVPKVDIVLLHLKSKEIDREDFELYRDFITYIFNQMNSSVFVTFKKLFTYKQLGHIKKDLSKNNYLKPTDVSSDYYAEIFKYFKMNGVSYRDKVSGYYLKHLEIHSKREKIHRSRV